MRALPERAMWQGAAAALAAAVIAGVYFHGRNPRPEPALPLEKLVMATPRVPHTALLQIAAAQGYFAEEGLEVTFVATNSGPEAVAMLPQSTAHLATAAEVVAVLAIMKGRDLGIVASIFSADEARIVARRDRGIGVPADLAGKTVGMTFGTAGEYFLWAYLTRLKLSAARMTFVNLPPADLPQALALGQIDAVSSWQPWVQRTQAALPASSTVTFSGDGSYTETHVLLGSREYLDKHPQALARLMRALLKAEQFNRSRPDEALALVAANLNVAPDSLRTYWKDFIFRVDLRQSQLVTLEEQASWAMARRHVAPGAIPNFLPNLYPDALLAVQPDRVTVLR